MELKEDLKYCMSSVFELNVLEISDDYSQEMSMVWDSLRHLKLVIALELKFDISFEPEEIAGMTSFEKIYRTIKKGKGDYE